jgi:GT2 family glycosyltransferase/glycosyltransferase involved in cell wall biosynthesis
VVGRVQHAGSLFACRQRANHWIASGDVFLTTSYSAAAGGAERALVEFVSALPGERILACPDGPLGVAARAAGIRVLRLPSRALVLRRAPLPAALALAGHALEVRRLTRDLVPDVVVAWGMRSLLACVPAVSDQPLLFQHNDLLPGPWLGRLVRGAARRARLVLALSDTIARDLDLDLDGRVEVIHPGVRPPGAPAPARGSKTVVVVGALAGWKRPDLALEAFALLRRRLPDAQLRFVGAPLEGQERFAAALRERAQAPELAGAVEFAGAVDDVGRELARAACLLHCADREPFGLAVLEALAAGRPVVVPAAAGPAEIADDACGLFYAPGSAAQAADALHRVLTDRELAGRLGAAGRVRACERFDRDAARRRWAGAVTSVARARSPAAPAGSLAVVTVTRNSAAALRGLLTTVDRHLPGTRVIVVDCASSDETLTVAQDRVTIALADNAGFARGCNRGLAEVSEPVTVLLNPDVELLDGSLALLAAEALRRDRPERLLAPLVMNPDGSRQDTVHARPGSAPELARALVPPALAPGAALAPWRATRPRRVGWAVGCALVARTDTLRRLGPFDERLFLYGEDLDLGLRAADAGVETWFRPDARIIHHRGHATTLAFGGEPFELLARARREVIERRLGPRRAALDDAAQAVTFASRIAAKRLLGRSAARERSQLQALTRVRRR